jgi:bidirectional [NiFe] hydrogenase diaphorase subunit
MSTSNTTRKMVSLTIDGRALSAPAGSYALTIARQAGIEIPTLCHLDALEPIGACRLCMIEVGHPDWRGWSGLMTACLYPVSEGIQILTRSPRVLRARQQILSLLAARCPSSSAIQELARKHGAQIGSLRRDPELDNCILCGLCSRICEAYGPTAITTYNRGSAKKIGSFSELPPTECVGCGACALICPTGHIVGTRKERSYQIWDQTFETATCHVDEARCLGCGACEEACPFSVPRVSLRANGLRAALIPREQCRGCGACVGACPSGAITQERFTWDSLKGVAS